MTQKTKCFQNYAAEFNMAVAFNKVYHIECVSQSYVFIK